MKLIIDSQALERLLGGNTELEVQLRTDIANQFADKFLKSLVNNQVLATSKATIEPLIKAELLSGSNQWNLSLNDKYKTLILKAIYESMVLLIDKTVKEELDSKHYKTLIDTFIENESSRIANEWTAANIQERINKAADEKIKKKLGL